MYSILRTFVVRFDDVTTELFTVLLADKKTMSWENLQCKDLPDVFFIITPPVIRSPVIEGKGLT